ncbi:MAG TPA: hypothetical protein VFC96_06545 [Anaerovoracaceae bacterium]|nr:hypothetical protein [Anaerovoracaceae bacterium]
MSKANEGGSAASHCHFGVKLKKSVQYSRIRHRWILKYSLTVKEGGAYGL